MDVGSWATAGAGVTDEQTPIVARPIAAHRRDSDDHAEKLSRGKASAGAGGDRGGSEGGQNIGRPLSLGGPRRPPKPPKRSERPGKPVALLGHLFFRGVVELAEGRPALAVELRELLLLDRREVG